MIAARDQDGTARTILTEKDVTGQPRAAGTMLVHTTPRSPPQRSTSLVAGGCGVAHGGTS
jgi:hypothetical protein